MVPCGGPEGPSGRPNRPLGGQLVFKVNAYLGGFFASSATITVTPTDPKEDPGVASNILGIQLPFNHARMGGLLPMSRCLLW